ncbi:hypothetical protein NESM_000557300 [Novymonas esmeraldas]|uniref:Uncharacterized protein n=1 Tax=Novymonas esmeraldas TaxID=1808958 RepID=A0AAW0EU01_9TRYP
MPVILRVCVAIEADAAPAASAPASASSSAPAAASSSSSTAAASPSRTRRPSLLRRLFSRSRGKATAATTPADVGTHAHTPTGSVAASAATPPRAEPPPMKSDGSAPQSAPPRHSLLWMSMQLTPTTTVEAVVRQVQDTVERRMRARVRVTVAAAAGAEEVSVNEGGGVQPTEHPAAARPSTATADTELCLCLEDTDGVLRWVGDAQHSPTAAVLRVPFVAEVCLRSHAEFEARRHRTPPSRSGSGAASDASSVSSPRHDRRRRVDAADAAGGGRAARASSTTPFTADAKFAFVKGVVVPREALLQPSPPDAPVGERRPRGRVTPPLHAAVSVPRDMRVEPLDLPLPEPQAPTAATAPPGTSSGPAAPPPPTLPPPPPPPPSSPPAPAMTGVSPRSSASLTSTQPSCSVSREHTRRDAGDVDSDGGGGGAGAVVSNLRTSQHAVEGPAGVSTRATAAAAADVAESSPTADDDAVRRGLIEARREYAVALAEYRDVAPHPHLGAAGVAADELDPSPPPSATSPADAEVAALLRRKLELQREVDACRQAEQQCERLTTVVEYLERELRDGEERRRLLEALHRRRVPGNSGEAGACTSCL